MKCICMKTTVRRGDHYLLIFPTHYLWPLSISLPSPLCLHLYPVPFLAPSLLPAPSHLSLPVALITSPQTLLLLHHLYYFLLQTTITLFLSCSCSHFSAFCFNHTTTPLPHPQSHPFISTRGFFMIHFCEAHLFSFATNFLHTLQNNPVPSYHYSTPLFPPCFFYILLYRKPVRMTKPQ